MTDDGEVRVSCTSLVLKNNYGEYSISRNVVDMNIGEMFAYLVEPVLNAAGYSKEVIDLYLDREADGKTTPTE